MSDPIDIDIAAARRLVAVRTAELAGRPWACADCCDVARHAHEAADLLPAAIDEIERLRAAADRVGRGGAQLRAVAERKAAARAVTLELDAYERDNLLWLINVTRPTHNTGDWHGQIRFKLKPELGPGNSNASAYFDAVAAARADRDALAAETGRLRADVQACAWPQPCTGCGALVGDAQCGACAHGPTERQLKADLERLRAALAAMTEAAQVVASAHDAWTHDSEDRGSQDLDDAIDALRLVGKAGGK